VDDALPPPPWTCRLRAVACLARVGGPGRRPAGFAVVDYAETPVGPYREALVAELAGPRSGTVVWMAVNSATSKAAGRVHWGLPKELAALAADPALSTVVVEAAGVRAEVRVRSTGLAVPVVVPALLRQPERPPARVRFRGRAQPAVVSLAGDLPCGLDAGTRPGVVLEGTLRIH
jgi:hypothetical protein